MTYRVVLSQTAKRELKEVSRWWAENRSADQAQRWYDGFLNALYGLDTFPGSNILAIESDDFSFVVRELHYGLSSRPTHRAIYTIADDRVVVLAIRHAAQDRISSDDVSESFGE